MYDISPHTDVHDTTHDDVYVQTAFQQLSELLLEASPTHVHTITLPYTRLPHSAHINMARALEDVSSFDLTSHEQQTWNMTHDQTRGFSLRQQRSHPPRTDTTVITLDTDVDTSIGYVEDVWSYQPHPTCVSPSTHGCPLIRQWRVSSFYGLFQLRMTRVLLLQLRMHVTRQHIRVVEINSIDGPRALAYVARVMFEDQAEVKLPFEWTVRRMRQEKQQRK